jgi:hypothetical protein
MASGAALFELDVTDHSAFPPCDYRQHNNLTRNSPCPILKILLHRFGTPGIQLRSAGATNRRIEPVLRFVSATG